MKIPLVAPSLLAADVLNLERDTVAVQNSGADFLHVDVMDGHLVPNLSFGLPLVRALKRVAKIPLDVHIMIANPDEMACEYAKAGADFVTFHPKASADPFSLFRKIKGLGVGVGVAVDPELGAEQIERYLPEIDLILIMAVKPGFGGQKFMEETYAKLAKLCALRGSSKVLLSVDGGVNSDNALKLRALGADILVAGSYIFGHPSWRKAIEILKGE